jgi:hypothetical protein
MMWLPLRLLFLLLLFGGTQTTVPAPDAVFATPLEQPVTMLPLAGEAARTRAELSGLAWYGDTLILLPQYPGWFDQTIFALPKAQIVDHLTGRSNEPLIPWQIPLRGGEILAELPGFEGFEAIAFAGDRAYLTIETQPSTAMLGYLVSGVMAADLSELRLQTELLTPIQPQAALNNRTDEAIVVVGDQVFTFYETNGPMLNPVPLAHRFAADDLRPLGTLPLAALDFRLTDASEVDAANRFWVINYYFPGDQLKFGDDPLAQQYGIGPTHRQSATVERLVQFEYTPFGFVRVEQPPIQLQLGTQARNWEGIVRLETAELSGFLLVSDTHPETLFAFVPDPE